MKDTKRRIYLEDKTKLLSDKMRKSDTVFFTSTSKKYDFHEMEKKKKETGKTEEVANQHNILKRLHKSSERKSYHKLSQRNYIKRGANDFEKADGVKEREKARKFNMRNNQTTKEKRERNRKIERQEPKKTSLSQSEKIRKTEDRVKQTPEKKVTEIRKKNSEKGRKE